MSKVQSVEPQVADFFNQQLTRYGLRYYLQQYPVNTEIESALSKAESKSGGAGGNRPDCKLLLQDAALNYYPVMIEYKGYWEALEKLNADGHPENLKKDNEAHVKNIATYAVNGAVHYANALLQYSSYTDVIAIGITGRLDIQGKLETQLGVYYVSRSNYGVGQKVGEFGDLSFLKPQNFNRFIERIKQLHLSAQELEKIHKDRENRIEDALTRINESLFGKQENLSALSRIHLVAASIMANLGMAGQVKPLEADNLKSSIEPGYTDGDIIFNKIKSFLKSKNIPERKQQQILSSLSITLLDEHLSKPKNGQSLLKEIFIEIVNELGYFYKVGLDTDFTGKLFNVMFRWLSFAGDDQNDVVLTPRYVAYLLAKLARVQQNSYVWDFATGSGGLLVAAMNLMLQDAKEKSTSPDALKEKEQKIKSEQILGIEVLPEIYMLAVLNMILMGDGSSNILQENSLTNFHGKYSYTKENNDFPADAFVLNPPYSAEGNGMVFVEKALNMMKKGYAAIIIQDSAGSGKAQKINQRILKKHTLLASIKMPIDLFIGKSSVQTSIYVFKVAEAHKEKSIVRFIDFQNDGYKRSNRKKAKASSNLQNIDHAEERYQEVVDLVEFGAKELQYLSASEFVEDTIAVSGEKFGADWNFSQHKKIDAKPTVADFKKTVADYLSWEVSQLLRREGEGLGK